MCRAGADQTGQPGRLQRERSLQGRRRSRGRRRQRRQRQLSGGGNLSPGEGRGDASPNSSPAGGEGVLPQRPAVGSQSQVRGPM